MIKIKLYELDKHRNECTFRPYAFAHNVIKDIGIEFITEGDSYDYAWIGQGSILDKKLPLQQAIDKGVEYISKISGDYMIVDGQDSTSLIGTYDVFKESKASLLLKSSLLKELVVTDTIPIKKESSKIRVITVADMFGDVMKKHTSFESISDHFVFANQ